MDPIAHEPDNPPRKNSHSEPRQRLADMRAGLERRCQCRVGRRDAAVRAAQPRLWPEGSRLGALVPGADNRDKAREDAPVRVIVAFDGDHSTLAEAEQKRFKRAKRLSGREPPYATLMYIWSEQVAIESVIPSAHTSQVKMLVAASGAGGLGCWQSLRRNLAEDYRRAYGASPGPVLGIAVMTDTDNTGGNAVGQYADIRFACAGR
jgi:Protein of unknown function (DUF3047)